MWLLSAPVTHERLAQIGDISVYLSRVRSHRVVVCLKWGPIKLLITLTTSPPKSSIINLCG